MILPRMLALVAACVLPYLLPVEAGAQTVVPWPKAVWAPSPRTQGLAPVQSLNKTWWVDGRAVQAPFGILNATPWTLTVDSAYYTARTTFYLHALPADTLYLYWEGLSGVAEIWLNGKLLHMTRVHDEEVLLALPPGQNILRAGSNDLQVLLRAERTASVHIGTSDDDLLVRGILKGGWLLRRDDKAAQQLSWPKPFTSDTLFFFKYYKHSNGQAMPDSLYRRYLGYLKNNGVRGVFFTTRPPNRLLNELGAMGMRLQRYPADSIKGIVPLIPFPGDVNEGEFKKFIDEQGRKTASGFSLSPVMVKGNVTFPAPTESSFDFGLRTNALLIAALPFLLLVFWRVYDGDSFNLVMSIRYQTAKSFELIAQNFFVRQSILLLVTSLRVLLLAAVLTFWYYIYHNAYPQAYWPFTPHGDTTLAARFVNQSGGGLPLALRLLALLLAANVCKYAVVWMLAQVYNRRQFIERLMALEAYAHLPWLLAIFLFGFAMLVVPARALPALYWAMAALCVFYLLRKYYLLTQGLGRALKLLPLVNILYICTLEFLPWFWVLW